jgi:hypothetical protein
MSASNLPPMAFRPLRSAVVGLAVVALASCGGGDDDSGTTTEGAQGESGGANGAVGQVLDAFPDPGSAINQFEAIDWEGNVVRRVSSGTSAPHGMAVVEATQSSAEGVCSSRCFFLIRDRPALAGDDLEKAEQSFDPTTNEPTVVLTLTEQGRRAFKELTRKVAQRGARQQSPGAASSASGSHFALIVGNKVVALPSIDPEENPEGIDGSSGVQIVGGFSVTEARGLAQALNPG